MARRVILDTQYTFNPATRTITIPRVIPRERLLLITNVTSNKVIYNFSDQTLTATNYYYTPATTAYTPETTTIVLSYNTTSMSSTDQLSIVVDEPAELFQPDEAFLDPVSKIRVSTPQALIDTDFEYGLQPTKWETISLLNNKASFYVNTQAPITITDVNATNSSGTVVVNTTANVAVGTPVLIQDTVFAGGNGPFIINSSNSTTFTYVARYPYTGVTGSVYNSSLTEAFQGYFYTGASYSLASQPTYSGNTVTVVTTEPHGLVIGNGVYVINATASTNPPNGSWYVSGVINATSFQYVTSSGTPTGAITNAVVYPRPDGIFIHRAFDGGVQFTTGNNSHNLQTIRQTRRYFRYQSGKGVQIITGTLLNPSLNVDDISYSGTTVTVTTKVPHQIGIGATIMISGTTLADGVTSDPGYNGTWTVSSVLNALQFQYITNTTPAASPAYGFPVLSVIGWYGAATRLGMFDNQNGIYFEYDGTQLYACRRRSVDQIGGFVNVTNGSATVTGATINGVTTKFTKQLNPGDSIVIRGVSYRVLNILSDTQMTISPAYRGVTLSGKNVAVVTKTIDLKIPQSQFNIDKLDGTGPSGLTVDSTKMQMYYLDYSWYGAGSIRFGFRDPTGKVFYCHRFVNTNQNYEAWMRSGNLPARYEVNTFPPRTNITQSIGILDSVIYVSNTSGFPSSGTLLIEDPASIEYVYYTGTTANSFTGITRANSSVYLASVLSNTNNSTLTTSSSVTGIQKGMYISSPGNIPDGTYVYSVTTGSPNNTIVMTQAASNTNTFGVLINQNSQLANSHAYSPSAPISVSLNAPQFAPTISHWGTSVIMDGRYDDDKSLIFTYGESTLTSVPVGATIPLLSIRVSPSVDSGIPGYLGQKEIVNRMQLKLYSTDVLTSGSVKMSLVLNGTVSNNTPSTGYANTFAGIGSGSSSLSQIADHSGNCVISGGETLFGFFAVNSAGANNTSVVSADLTGVRDLGNSIIGGAPNNTVGSNIYPDGPDVVTLVAQNIGTTSANVNVRLSWTEAQA